MRTGFLFLLRKVLIPSTGVTAWMPLPKQVTKALTDAGKIMHIDLLDHIIVGENAYYSFLESGWR